MQSILDFLNGNQMQQPMQAQPQMDNGNIAQRIQELLGTREPDAGGMAGDILSSRFDTGYGDYANGVVQSAMGKPTLGPEVAQNRFTNGIKQIEGLATAQRNIAMAQNGGTQGATLAATQALMASDPTLDFATAYSFAKSGLGPTMTRANGQVVPMAGAPQAASTMSNAKQTGQNLSDLAIKPTIKQNEEKAAKIGANQGENAASLANAEASYPQLEQTINQLSELGKKATYTIAGQAADSAVRQTGLGATQGAQAREAYVNTVRNVLFPQLRATFGAQFTAKEGEALIGTLGDLNKSPQEKDAALRAFIDQKRQSIGSMRRASGAAPAATNIDPRIATAKAHGYTDEEIQQYLSGGQ